MRVRLRSWFSEVMGKCGDVLEIKVQERIWFGSKFWGVYEQQVMVVVFRVDEIILGE